MQVYPLISQLRPLQQIIKDRTRIVLLDTASWRAQSSRMDNVHWPIHRRHLIIHCHPPFFFLYCKPRRTSTQRPARVRRAKDVSVDRWTNASSVLIKVIVPIRTSTTKQIKSLQTDLQEGSRQSPYVNDKPSLKRERVLSLFARD